MCLSGPRLFCANFYFNISEKSHFTRCQCTLWRESSYILLKIQLELSVPLEFFKTYALTLQLSLIENINYLIEPFLFLIRYFFYHYQIFIYVINCYFLPRELLHYSSSWSAEVEKFFLMTKNHLLQYWVF